MKIITGLIGLVILVLVLCFALSNRQDVFVGIWPFDGAMQMPLYIVGFVPLALGLAFGGLWGWVASLPHRWRARRLGKEVELLNEKIIELQKAVTIQIPHIPPKWKFWRRKK